MVVAVEYEFTSDWFSHHEGAWRQILQRLSPTRILEIGSYEGRSACFLIAECASVRPIELHCVDSWEGGREYDNSTMGAVEQRFDRNLARAIEAAPQAIRFRKYRQRSSLAMAQLLTEGNEAGFDLIYIDGSHEAPHVLADAILAFQLLRVDGYMIFDDYLWLRDGGHGIDHYGMPKPAIDAFMGIYQQQMRIVRAPLYQLYTRKVAHT